MRTLMRKLVAAKSHRYGTRQLKAGDEYEASRMHSRVLVGSRLARYAEEPERKPGSVARAVAERAQQIAERREAGPVPPPTNAADEAEEKSQPDQADLARLRHQARGLGVEVDLRWGVNRLNREIQARAGDAAQAGTRR